MIRVSKTDVVSGAFFLKRAKRIGITSVSSAPVCVCVYVYVPLCFKFSVEE